MNDCSVCELLGLGDELLNCADLQDACLCTCWSKIVKILGGEVETTG